MNTRTRTIHAPARRRTSLAVRAALLGLSMAALAAPAQADDVAPARTTELDKVQVTGERVEAYDPGPSSTSTGLALSSRQTPQAVTVVTAQRIQDEGMETVTDVVNRTTGISVNQYETNRAGFTARGFDITNLQVDGVPTSWDAAWSSGEVQTSLAIFDRVEVVRGPTGLMTGAGDPSAAINLVRKRADSRELAATVELGYGRWNQARLLGDVSGALNSAGTVRARGVVEYTEGDSFRDYASDTRTTVFGTVEFDLAPSTVLVAGASRQETEGDGPMWGGLPYLYADTGRVIPWDVSDTTAPKWASWDTEYTSYYARFEHAFAGGWKLRATATRGDRHADSFLLYLSGPLVEDGTGLTAFPGSYITHSVQDDYGLHLSGPLRLGGRSHELAFGAMYSDKDFTADSRNAAWPYPEVGDFDDWDGNYPVPDWSAPAMYEVGNTQQKGFYAVARWSLADTLRLITGARLSSYNRTGSGLWTTPYEVDIDDEVTPYAGIVWDFSRAWSAYASYTDIFQPQDARDFDNNLLDPIVGRGIEGGIKGELLDGRLYAAASVFRIEQDNLAQEAGVIDRGNGPEVYYRGAEGATSTGYELELAGRIAEGWNASLGWSAFQAEDAAGAPLNTIYPRRLLRLFTTWEVPGTGLTVGGGSSWESSTWTGLMPGVKIKQESHALVNLMARYAFTPQLALQLNVDNAFDEEYFGMFAAYNALTYGSPRNVTATLRYRF